MTNEISLRRDVDKAAKVKALLDNEVFSAVLDELETDYVNAWRATQSHQFEARETMWHAIQALADVRAKLQRAVDNGIVAEAELKAAGL